MFSVFGYTVNYVDISLILIFLIATIIGYARGFLITLVNLLRYSVGLFLCFYFSSNLTQIIYDNYVRQMALNYINDKLSANGIDAFLQGFGDKMNSLPSFLTSSADLSVLTVKTENIADVILLNVLEPVLLTVIKIVIFLLVFILFFVSTGIIIHIIRKISESRDKKRGHKTILKKTDKIIGGLIGICKSFVIVLAITSVLMYILSLGSDKNAFLLQLQESRVLQFLNSINPFNAITEGLI